MLEEIRNNYESYIYQIKNKLIDNEEAITAVTTQEQRDQLIKSADDAESWMYDEGYDASLEVYTQKYNDLTEPAEKIFFRMKEVPARAEAIAALKEKLNKVSALMTKWETTMPQVTEEERKQVLDKVAEVNKWIDEKEAAQAAADPASDPIFTSEEVPLQTKELQILMNKLSKKPKPVPKKEDKKNETDVEDDKNQTEKETDSNGSEEKGKEGEDVDAAGDNDASEGKEEATDADDPADEL